MSRRCKAGLAEMSERQGLKGSTRSLDKKSGDLENVQRQDANRSLRAELLELTKT